MLLEHNTIHGLAEYIGKTAPPLKKQIEQTDSQSSNQHDMQSVTSRDTEPQTPSSAKIAVIGIGCKFPGAADKEEFWDNLRKGKNHIKEVPDSRWNIEENYSPVQQKGKSISKWGGFINGIGSFDPEYFRMEEEKAIQTDPLIRHFLETSVQTVRDAGYEETELSGKKSAYLSVPEWAATVTNCRKKAAATSSGLVKTLLLHMCRISLIFTVQAWFLIPLVLLH